MALNKSNQEELNHYCNYIQSLYNFLGTSSRNHTLTSKTEGAILIHDQGPEEEIKEHAPVSRLHRFLHVHSESPNHKNRSRRWNCSHSRNCTPQ